MSVDLLKWSGAARVKAVVLILAVGLAGAAWTGCGSSDSTDTVNSIQEEARRKGQRSAEGTGKER